MAGRAPGRRRPAGGRRGGLFGLKRRAAVGVDGRIRLLRLVFIAFLVLVGGRAVALAATSQDLTQLAQNQQTDEVVLPAHRGSILDRSGQKLAVGKPQKTVYATPSLLDDPKAAAEDLCKALQINRRGAQRDVAKALSDKDSGFEYVARKVDPALAKDALALGLPGVGAYEEEERTYPMKGTAAQVIGFAGTDNKGLAGIELLYDEQLGGESGSETTVFDTSRRAIKTERQKEPVPGADVRLTLDAALQYQAEDVLEKTIRSTYAKAATAVIMDPKTGEVLTMASVTKDGFHGFGKDAAADKNRAVENVYEPGSIFKLVTISGALEDGKVKPDTSFTLASSIHVADREINESEPRGTVTYSVREILQHSSNVGAVTIGIKMGKKGLAKWVDAFGFGEPTGIQFPIEAAGIVPPVEEWSDSSIGNIPMGQGIAVTPLQMAVAFSTVANNGVAVKPRLVTQVGTEVFDETEKHRVISARVARQVRDMLALAVAEGTGDKAQIPGYEVAGKTGTAEIPIAGGYAKDIYVASFVGMVPADHPKLVVLVAVDSTPMYGGDAAAPAVQKIMRFAIQHLEIAP